MDETVAIVVNRLISTLEVLGLATVALRMARHGGARGLERELNRARDGAGVRGMALGPPEPRGAPPSPLGTTEPPSRASG